ncbi:MAG: YceI family protein [Bacteroidia bacterium]|nr:YceI family protein [Bacteroidia bacterium]
MNKINWALDPSHSEVGFKVKHLMITNVSGSFSTFNAEVSASDETFNDADITFTADIDSISTNDANRDGHLKSADFFDVANHPHLTIKASGLPGSGESRKLHGTMTLHGVSQPVALDVEFGGVTKDPWGNMKAGFSLNGKINRKDFGLNWNSALETGGVLLGDEVKLHAEIQLVKKA